ncbi:hypothetical protein C4M80_03025 [Mycoplasmopsis pullorum]|uniref:class I SAM-dependent RNA methyltransferase n=1 Tax=Mycoplasmopsis pullorum TaxID=48003 RepID=UPI0011196AA5|nr:methyltransferase [Mycoplasmopsis pullorum]TNK82431.1 hypothetical protein C4M80_03025 [Mycoplasmopsis pullorum]
MTKIRINDEIIVKANEVSYQGLGVFRDENFAIFVQGLYKDEEALIRITKVNKNFAFGHVLKYLSICESRIETPNKYLINSNIAPFFGIEYSEQFKWKQEYANKVINWNLKEFASINKFYPSAQEIGYRNKSKYFLEVKNNILVCSSSLFNSNETITVDNNPIENPILAKTIKKVVPVINEYYFLLKKNKHLYNYENILGRVNEFGDVSLSITIHPDYSIPQGLIERLKLLDLVELWEFKKTKSGYKKLQMITKKPFKMYFENFEFDIKPDSFFQVDLQSFKNVVNDMNAIIEQIKPKRIVDLYCGVGFLGIVTNKKDTELLGIDLNENSIESAKQNLKNNGFKNFDYKKFDLTHFDEETELRNDDLVLVDPPREGLTEDVINWLTRSKIQNIIYISCDIKTLIRDLKIFRENGHKVKLLNAYDNFARTSHFELLCWIEK